MTVPTAKKLAAIIGLLMLVSWWGVIGWLGAPETHVLSWSYGFPLSVDEPTRLDWLWFAVWWGGPTIFMTFALAVPDKARALRRASNKRTKP